MSDELSAVVRGLAREEGLAAELDYPYTPEARARFVRDVRRRRVAGAGALVLVAVAVLGGGALGVDRLTREVPPVEMVQPDPTTAPLDPTPSATAMTPAPTPTPTPTATQQPTEEPVATPTPPTTNEPEHEEEPPPPPPPDPPAAISTIRATPGGGSGEIMVWWDQVAGATGYRVYRSDSRDGPFAPAASIDLATGDVDITYGGWYEYIWMKVGIQSPDAVEYGEAIGTFGYFRVAPFNAGGEGPLSRLVCAEPQNGLSVEVTDC